MTQPEALRLADLLEPCCLTIGDAQQAVAAELRRLHAELERCKQVCAATSEAWREEAALAEPVQEPVAWGMMLDGQIYDCICPEEHARCEGEYTIPLYTVPPQPAEPIEPVAWSFEARHIDSAWAAAVTLKHPGPEGKYMRKVTPLYTAPPQRKPLTEEEIDGLMQSIGLRCADDGNERMSNHAEWERGQRRRIARAIERAHGIAP